MKQTEIIPSITVKTFEEVQEKIKAVELYINWVHLDVVDGDFAPNKTWGDPVSLHDYDPGVFIEAHLMVQEPETVINDWITGRSEERDSGVGRIYFHWEATSAHDEIIQKIKKADKQAGIALLPETPVHVLSDLNEKLDAILVFSGTLGFYGGEFEKEEKITIAKIFALRQMYPDITIEVDGGMNPENAKKVVEAGADAVVSGSYIWQHKKGVKEAIDELKKAINN